MRQNDERVSQVASILSAEEPEIDVADLLADIMHFCIRNGVPFAYLVDAARTHFIMELNEELEGSIAELFVKMDNESKEARASEDPQEGLEIHVRENDKRVSRVASLMSAEEPNTDVLDLLADVMHFCIRNGVRFPSLLDKALARFTTELNEELEGPVEEMFVFKELFTADNSNEPRGLMEIVQNLE